MGQQVSDSRRALVVSYSVIVSDPRVRREISWLRNAGWEVDSLGLPGEPPEDVCDHFELGEARPWTTTYWGTGLLQGLLPRKSAYRLQVVDRIPQRVRARVRAGYYSVVILNETEFGPWVTATSDFKEAPVSPYLHCDLHEYHNPVRRRNTFGGIITSPYYRWVRSHIGKGLYDSYSVVNEQIGKLYQSEFGIDELIPLRNVPKYWDLEPSAVNPEQIRLIFHGLAGHSRGFGPLLEAMKLLPGTFTLTFMIMPHPVMEAWLNKQIENHPAKDRIKIVPPAPMLHIAEYVNEYDIEVIYYPAENQNLIYALPNKFFEAMQARLAVVVGDKSKAMRPMVEEYKNGIVVPGHSGKELAKALGALTPEQIMEMKEASGRAAQQINAENEGKTFVQSLTVKLATRGKSSDAVL